MQLLKSNKDNGIAAYNYKDNKADLMCKIVLDYPQPDTFVNTKLLERTFKFIKLLLKNEAGLNDLVKDELKPHDR